MENRITKRLETGEAYFEGQSGKSYSDIRGRVFGEAADRLAWIEDKIAENDLEAIKNLYCSKDLRVTEIVLLSVSPLKKIYVLQTEHGYYVDVMHSVENENNLIYVVKFADGTMAYDEHEKHLDIEVNEQKYVDFVRNKFKLI